MCTSKKTQGIFCSRDSLTNLAVLGPPPTTSTTLGQAKRLVSSPSRLARKATSPPQSCLLSSTQMK